MTKIFFEKVFFGILQTVLAVDMIFLFRVSTFKNVEFMDKIVQIKLRPKIMFFMLTAKNSFANIEEPVTILLYDLEC